MVMEQSNKAQRIEELKRLLEIEYQDESPVDKMVRYKNELDTISKAYHLLMETTLRVHLESLPIQIINTTLYQYNYYFSTGFTLEILKEKNRKLEVVLPRQICQYLLCLNTSLSDKEIGNLFNRDRTTVIHARTTISDLIEAKGYENYKKVISISDYLIKRLNQ